MNSAFEEQMSFWEQFYRSPLLSYEIHELSEKGVFSYIVSRGETLQVLAEKFYADSRLDRWLASWNSLQTGAHLKVGQQLKLPVPRLRLLTSLEVTKKRGDGCVLEAAASGRRFRREELFRLRVASNASGWLYIFNRDDAGRWRRLHPALTTGGAINRFTEYSTPNDAGRTAWFQLDRDRGDEELVLLFGIDPIEELAEFMDLPAGEELKESQEILLEELFVRKERAAKSIIRTEGDYAKRETGAIIALGPDSGEPILIHRIRLQREA